MSSLVPTKDISGFPFPQHNLGQCSFPIEKDISLLKSESVKTPLSTESDLKAAEASASVERDGFMGAAFRRERVNWADISVGKESREMQLTKGCVRAEEEEDVFEHDEETINVTSYTEPESKLCTSLLQQDGQRDFPGAGASVSRHVLPLVVDTSGDTAGYCASNHLDVVDD